jgi:hypothetical protein
MKATTVSDRLGNAATRNRTTPMKRTSFLVASIMMLTPLVGKAAEKHAFNVTGTYIEGCACAIPCTCPMTVAVKGCQGIDTMELGGGTYNGVDLKGVKIAVAKTVEEWSRVYLDAPDPKQREAAAAFGTAWASQMGKVEAVKDARIEFSGKDGSHTVKVDDGKIAQLTTKVILGADEKNPLSHVNLKTPLNLNPTLYQARTLSGSFRDGDRSFELKDSNSYFNSQMKASGEL